MANTALAGFSRAVRASGTEVRMAQLQAERAAATAALSAGRLSGMSASQVTAARQHIASLDQETAALRQNAAAEEARRLSTMRTATAVQAASQTATALGYTLTLIGAAGIYGFSRAAKAAIEYEQAVRATGTQVTTFKVDLQKLGEVGKRAAKDIAVPLIDMQRELFYIFSSTNANLQQGEVLLRAIAKAAVAGETSIEVAGKGVIGIMNAFHIPLENVNKVLDVQFQMFRKGVGTYAEFAAQIGRVSPSAARAGQSIEMMGAMMAFATRNGLSVSQAATTVARSLDALSNPKAVDRMKALGVAFYDSAGKARPLTDVLTDLKAKFDKLKPEDKTKAIQELFKTAGNTAQMRRFIDIIFNTTNGLDDLKALLGDMKGSIGEFEKAYASMADTTKNKTQILKNNWDILKTDLGEAFLPRINDLIMFMGKLLKAFNDLDPGTRHFIANMLLLATAAAAVGGPMLVLLGAVGNIVAALVLAGPVFSGVLLALTAIGLAVAGLGVAFVIAYKNSATFRDKVNDLRDAFLDVKKKVGDTFGPIIKQFKDEFMPKIEEGKRIVKDFAEKTLTDFKRILKEDVQPALEQFGAFWDSHKETFDRSAKALGDIGKALMVIAAALTHGNLVVGLQSLALILQTLLIQWETFALVIQTVAFFMEFCGTQVKSLSKAIGELWDKISKQEGFKKWGDAFKEVGDFIARTWENAGNAVRRAIDIINQSFSEIMSWPARLVAWVLAVWDAFTKFTLIGQIVQGAFNLVGAIIRGFIDWVKSLPLSVQTAINQVGGIFLSLPGRIAGALAAIPGIIIGIFGSALSNAVSYASALVSGVAGTLASLPGRVAGAIAGIIGVVGAILSSAAATARSIASALVSQAVGILASLPGRAAGAIAGIIGNIAGIMSSAAGTARNIAGSLVGQVVSVLSSLPGRAAGAVAGIAGAVAGAIRSAAGAAFSAGAAVVQGAISGILSKVGALASAASSLAGIIASNKGPKSKDLKLLVPAGRWIMEGLISGINQSVPYLKNTMGGVSSAIGVSGTTGFASRPSILPTSKNVTVNVYTNEIDPRYTAAKLGFELAGAL